MNLKEEVLRIKNLIYELSPQSSVVIEFMEQLQQLPELIKHLKFDSLKDVKDYVDDATYEEFAELRIEVEHFIDRRKRYFKDEMDEFERAAQDLTRDEGLEISVDKIINSFLNSKEITLNDKVWSKLENTESNKIKKGESKKVIDIAKKYNKSSPKELSKAIKSGDYKRPLILKFGDRYHLVAGNTRLCTAAALGIKPKVLIGEI